MTGDADDVLCERLERAFEVKLENRRAFLVDVRPVKTVPVTVTGRRCSLDCAHCGGRYLENMVTCDRAGETIRKKGATSVLLSGGCDPDGKVPVLENLDGLRRELAGLKVNVHPGIVGDERALEIARVADVVSFDFVHDEKAVELMFGRRLRTADFLESYRYLRKYAGDKLVPHVLVGIRAGEMALEYETVETLAQEGLSSLVFIVFIPTPGTRWARMKPPPATEVAKLIAWTRDKLPHVMLSLGCMRPGGTYRRKLDELAVLAGVDKIVLPSKGAIERARELELDVRRQYECCAFPLPSGESGSCRVQKSEKKLRRDAGNEPVAVPGGSRTLPHDAMSGGASVGVSLGTAVVLGLSRARTDSLPTTAYISVGDRCVRDCSFCPRGRSSTARGDLLSRVTWPLFPWAEVLSRLAGSGAARHVCRVCLQLVESPSSMPLCLDILRDIRSSRSFVRGMPVSVSVSPYSVARVKHLFAAGASRVGLPLDAVNPGLYSKIKGGDLERAWGVLARSVRLFPGRVSTHFIAGLGETEEEMVHAMARALTMGVTVGLFAFTPVRGTTLENRNPPPVPVYRRLQIALHLLKSGVSLEDFRFSEGRIAEVRCRDRAGAFETDLLKGKAFETTGCPGCNRPFYNERPGSVMMNHPHRLDAREARRCVSESGFVRRGGSLVVEVDAGEDEALENRGL